jgi:hypothetical protein
MTVALDELYGLGHGHIDLEDAKYEAVTVEQTGEVARKYLDPMSIVVSVIQPDKST